MASIQRIRLPALGLHFPILIDHAVSPDAHHPGFQRSQFRLVAMQCSVHFEKNLLRQVLGVFKSATESVRVIVDTLVVTPDYGVPCRNFSCTARTFSSAETDPVTVSPITAKRTKRMIT